MQSAYAGANGLYYIENNHKYVVKCDGTAMIAEDGWGDRNYYVSFGAGCRSNHVALVNVVFVAPAAHWHPPFGSYENASRVFEKSVNAVQRMMKQTSSYSKHDIQ